MRAEESDCGLSDGASGVGSCSDHSCRLQGPRHEAWIVDWWLGEGGLLQSEETGKKMEMGRNRGGLLSVRGSFLALTHHTSTSKEVGLQECPLGAMICRLLHCHQTQPPALWR